MGQTRFDWRWIAAIILIAILVAGTRVPWPIFMLALGVGGGYLIYLGWKAWTGAAPGGGGKRVTYWRGQRIELEPERGSGMPPLKAIAPALLYLLLGGALVVGAFAVLLRQI